MVLLCAVISQGHMIKGSRYFMGGYHHAKLGGQRHYGSGDLMILVGLERSHDYFLVMVMLLYG